jgi:hypothetical protein
MVILGRSTLHTESPATYREARSQVMQFKGTVFKVHGPACRTFAAGVAAVLASLGSALAQPTESLMVDVGPCVGIESAEQRFACYEQRVDTALRSRFSTTGAAAAARPAAQSDEIVATVTSVNEIVPNRLQVTLDNGQVWRQTATRRYPLRAGHEVRISQANLGGYRLSAESLGGFIRVEQVR